MLLNSSTEYSASGLKILNSATGGTYVSVSGDILPTRNLTFNLGSPTNQWGSLYVGTGSIYMGDILLSGTNIPSAPTGPTGPVLTINRSIVPNNYNTLSLGSYANAWKEIYIGPGSLNIAGPTGALYPATIGSDLAGVAYSQYGFASPFLNVGPELSATDGAVGGWHMSSTGQPQTPNFDLVVQQISKGGLTGSLTGPIYSLLHPTGTTGPQGPTGSQGIAGYSSGLVLFLDSSGGLPAATPDNSGTLLTVPNLATPSTTLVSANSGTKLLIGQFTTPPNSLTSTVIAGGEWDMNLFASCPSSGTTAPSFYFSVYEVSGGVENVMADGSGRAVTIQNSTTAVQNTYSLYVPARVLASPSSRIRVKLYVNINSNNKALTAYFRDSTQTHVHTSLVGNVTYGPTGPTGPTPQGTTFGDYLYWDGSASWVIGSNPILLGANAGQTNQGANAIAIGYQAGSSDQGAGAIALGYQAGQNGMGQDSIAIGYQADQSGASHANTIVLNAAGSAVNPNTGSAFYVAPVRTAVGGDTYVFDISNTLFYNPTTSEITYAPTKTFIIDHPTNPDRHLVHACLEGPEVGVYYRGKGTIAPNTTSTVITLPAYVSAFANNFTVQITPLYTPGHPVSLYAASEIVNNTFEVHGQAGSFYWHVHGSRGQLEVEPLRSAVTVHGDGPYKWIA